MVLAGAGIGLCFTPLTATVLANVEPALAGGAAGAMSAITQVGYALGVAVTGVIFFAAADGGIDHAFELSLIQLAAVAAGIIVMSRLLPRKLRNPIQGIRQMSHKPNKSPIRWLKRHGARRIDISQDLDGNPVVYACFDLAPEQIAAVAHAVAATAGERFRVTEMSADDVLELRELTTLADELGELATAPARSCCARPGSRRCSTPSPPSWSRVSRPSGCARRTSSRSRWPASCSTRSSS